MRGRPDAQRARSASPSLSPSGGYVFSVVDDMKKWPAAANRATTSHCMKQYPSKRTQTPHVAKPQNRSRAKAPAPKPTQPADVIKFGVDVGLRKYAYCRQVDGSKQDPPHLTSPADFKELVVAQKQLARRVVVCYEAGFLGFELARWLISHEIECVVMAPVKLDEANTRVETDKLNAQEIGSRLDRYLAGNTRALTACRIPTRQEELLRYQTRQRQQLLDDRRALQAQGRSVLWQFGYIGDAWWQSWDEEAGWQYLTKALEAEPELLQGLGRLRAVILEVNKQMEELMDRLEAQADQALPESLKELPVGVGWLSMMILLREVMDWNRFKNRRQAGCFSGLVPSESSTGERPWQGSVTKVGNPVVRAILIEMAWRVARLQPNYQGVKRWARILNKNNKAGRRARKRAIVAVARVLMVDLWRLATGQTTAEKLGLTLTKAPQKKVA